MKKFNIKQLNQYVVQTDICCEQHPSADLFLYGYLSIFSDAKRIWDDVNVHCRGLIVDSSGKVIEHPFVKFWMFKQYLSAKDVLMNENKIFRIPDCPFRILEKIDGTMVMLYWVEDKPYLATQRSFTNPKAKKATEILYKKYGHTFSKFNRNYTYVFEAVYPEIKVLIDYGNLSDLFLIGIVDKKNGQLLPLEDIGFPMAHDYSLEYGHFHNFNDLMALDLPNKEGFVIQYENGALIKVKFPWYLQAHRILDDFIFQSHKFYQNRLKLNSILQNDIGFQNISTSDIRNALFAGDNDLRTIKNSVMDIYFSMGLDYWLETEKNRLLQEPNTKTNYVFNIEERLLQPHIYESIIWNWEKRFLK